MVPEHHHLADGVMATRIASLDGVEERTGAADMLAVLWAVHDGNLLSTGRVIQ
jgi:hypothetical protein